jgi:Leucine-rich repeat (LRR) protein
MPATPVSVTPHSDRSETGVSTPKLQQIQQRFNDDPLLAVIQKNLPADFHQASARDQKDYCRALLNSKRARENLKSVLQSLKGLSEFAEPLLRDALDRRFGPGLDPATDTLFHPTLRASGATGSATQLTLLEAALHNFERKESAAGGFLKSASVCKGTQARHPKGISPEQFADLCRHLNLGRKYQDHLQSVLEPEAPDVTEARAARLDIRARFVRNDRADMELYGRAAFLRKKISRGALDAVLAVASRQPDPTFNGLAVGLESISLFDVEIPRAVLIKPLATWTFTQVPLVLYIPQDPVSPFQEFNSLTDVEDELRRRLMKPSYQQFFGQLIGERKKAAFLSQLNRHLFPLAPVSGNIFKRGLWHHTPDLRANLQLETAPIEGELSYRLYQQQLDQIKDNARFLAVPTEDEDAKSRHERLQAWLDMGMNIANVASFFIPLLGQAMMAYSAVELASEVYHGIEDLTHGDLAEGLDHLTGAAANIAFMVALGKAAGGAELPEPPAIHGDNFVGPWVPVTLVNGQTRLWKADLEPFRTRLELPAGVTLDIEGIVDLDGKKYLTIDEHSYEVVHRADINKWQLKHPLPRHPLAPVLESNGAGAFRHATEDPATWAAETLFKRLGHSVSGISNVRAEQILAIACADSAALRDVHVQSVPPHGQLQDTIKRFQIDASLESFVSTPEEARPQAFERLYAASEQSTDAAVKRLKRDFPTLPSAVADDLIATAHEAETVQMIKSDRVPLRLAEACAWHVRQTRLNRALEGFQLTSVINPDTETLALSLLEKLPGWSDQVRLDVREDLFRGRLLTTVGNSDAVEVKVLVKSAGQYQAFDADGGELNSLPAEGSNLFASVLHALPDAARSSIGFAHVGRGPELQAALAQLAITDRERAALILGQKPSRLTFNKPERLKDGRLGYGLSGRGRLPGHILEDHLLEKLGSLELRNLSAQEALQQLRAAGMSAADINGRLDVLLDERQALRNSLDEWAHRSSQALNPGLGWMASRTRIGDAILDHWEAASFSASPTAVVFRLESVVLEHFPEQLPAFFYPRVGSLHLSNVVNHFGAPRFLPTMPGRPGLLEAFLGRFPETTAVEISRTPSSSFTFTEFPRLPAIVSGQLPRLTSLRLIDQGMDITTDVLNAFGAMPHLEALDLSGNRFGLHLPAVGSVSLHLRQLSLNRMGMDRWPHWVNSLIPEHIGELSLADNQLSHIPDEILHSPPSARTTSIDLQGNRLSRSEIIEASLRGATSGHATRIEVDVRQDLQAVIVQLAAEQRELQAAVRDWAQASTSSAPLTADVQAMRERVGASLTDHWLSTVAGRISRPVLIESMALADFPQVLPATFYRNVCGLQLTNVTTQTSELNRFLERFSHLTSLHIEGQATQLDTFPPVLGSLASLTDLTLVDLGLEIDQSRLEFLSSLDSVRHLNLSGNRLGPIAFGAGIDRHWESLILDNMGLTTWPQWLDPFLPGGIDALSLSQNLLTELPDEIIRNRRTVTAHTELTLEGNPLSDETMRAAHVSEFGNTRSFSFYMDLPPEIRDLPPERAWSSSSEMESESLSESDDDDDFPVHRHGVAGGSNAGAADIASWLQGTSAERDAHQATWDQIATAADAPMLMALISRLRETADYRKTRELLATKVWHVLGAAANDPALRALLNAMAEEAIVSRTCGDGVRLEFNQLEVQVFARDSLRDIPAAERGRALYRLMERLYRLDEVDALARTNVRGRDEAEVRLAYRLRLADSLNLPLPPTGMLYRTAAAVTADELHDVEGLVLTRQDGPEFMSSAINRDFWAAWLRETYATEFAALKTTFDAEHAALEDEFAELNDAYLARVTELQAEQKTREQALLKQLTYQEGVKYSD